MNNTGNDPEKPSKSELKREAKELTKLARKLLRMPFAQLKNIPLDEDLREAVDFGRRIRAHGANKRQAQTIGKMLRRLDATPIVNAINNLELNIRQINVRHRHLEAWRDRLIEGKAQGLVALLAQNPDFNLQTLRQLVRNANKEAQLGKPPAIARKLFKLLRDSDAENPLPPLPQD